MSKFVYTSKNLFNLCLIQQNWVFLGKNLEKIGFSGFKGITPQIHVGFIGTWAQIYSYLMIGTHFFDS